MSSPSRADRGPADQCEIRGRNLTHFFAEGANGPRARPGSAALVEFAAEPGPGVGPVPIRGAGLESEVFGSLLQSVAEEEPEVDQAGGPGVLRGQPGQGLV